MTDTDTDWLSTPANVEEATPPKDRTLAMRAGLLAAGAIVGGIVVTSVHHNSTTTTPTAFTGAQGAGQFPGGTTGQLPGGTFQGGPPQGGFGGGLDGEQHLTGTLVSVGSSTVTVRTTSGTATYLVTSSTEIVRNGQAVALRALKAGDPVLVHVYPSGSSARLTVERLFAGSSSQTGSSSTT